MDEIIVKFTKQEISNFREFLLRVQLVGKEVPAYVEILNKLNNALIEQSKK
jgi:hypothetical protein